ncbi:MAG: VOC family protein [Actinomycetota bacterium]
MLKNPPEGYHTLTPQTIVEDAHATIDFLVDVFGADVKEIYEDDGFVHHAELFIGDSIVMVASASEDFPAFPFIMNVYVEDVDTTFASAVEHGATPLREPTDQFYGDRTGGVLDSQGNQWWISTHIEDVSEEEIRRRMAEMSG